MWDKRPKRVSLPQYLQSWHRLTTFKNTQWWPLPFCVKCTLGKEHQTDWKQTQEHSSNPLHNPHPLSSLWGDHYCTCKRIKVSLKGGQFVYISIVFWQANGQIERQTNGKTKKIKNRKQMKPRKKKILKNLKSSIMYTKMKLQTTTKENAYLSQTKWNGEMKKNPKLE